MVLVIEDHASVGGLVAALVRTEGHRVVRAWEPQEAFRAARGRTPDLILLDVNLPYPEGAPPVMAQLRGNEATRRCPLLVVAGSALALPQEEQTRLVGVVARPYHIEVLLNAVRKGLGEPTVDVQLPRYDSQDSYLHAY